LIPTGIDYANHMRDNKVGRLEPTRADFIKSLEEIRGKLATTAR
jgi:hypothetical protein